MDRYFDKSKVFVPPKKPKTIILGMGLSVYGWMKQIYGQPNSKIEETCNVWAINHAAYALQCTAAINMHDPEQMFAGEDRRQHREALINCKVPVVMPRSVDWIPNSVEYPLGDVVDEFGENYLSNGVAYAVALAMLSGTEEIHLYGCDFDYPDTSGEKKSPYERGRPCVEFWLGYARAKGFLVGTSGLSTLLDACYRKEGLYGYGDKQPSFAAGDNMKATFQGWHSNEDFDKIEAQIETPGQLNAEAIQMGSPQITQHLPGEPKSKPKKKAANQ